MGTLTFQATAGGSVNLLGPNISGTVNLTLPSADGTSGQPLQTNGSGTLSFANLAIANGGTGATSFTANQIHYGSFSQSANLTFNGTTLTANTLNLTNALGTSYGGTGLTSFTANGVVYASSTSALATGSAIQFDGTNLGLGAAAGYAVDIRSASSTALRVGSSGNAFGSLLSWDNTLGAGKLWTLGAYDFIFGTNSTEGMRLTSTGLGIGTSSPSQKLQVNGAIIIGNYGSNQYLYFDGTTNYVGRNTSNGDIYLASAAGQGLALSVGGTTKLYVASTGIVTMSAYGVGTATFSASGVISSVSDETWKIKDGVPVDPDSMLKKLEPGYWYYNEKKKEIFGVDRQLGFYAQNVNAAIGPEAAPTPEEGKPWGYYDRSVLAVTVMSLQKALATIESLTARIEALETK